jgi:hypothetical protein
MVQGATQHRGTQVATYGKYSNTDYVTQKHTRNMLETRKEYPKKKEATQVYSYIHPRHEPELEVSEKSHEVPQGEASSKQRSR